MYRRGFAPVAALVSLYLWFLTPVFGANGHVDVYPVEGVISPVIVEFMLNSIEQSIANQATAVVFQLDTPGGLVESTRRVST
jgi:membrane-bound serine protease (ClpP class)